MKRLIAVIIIIAAVLSLTVTSSFIIRKFHNLLSDQIENIELLYGEDKITDKDLMLLKENWNNAQNILMIFANHDSLNEIELNITRLWCAAKEKNSSSFYSEAEELKCRLNILKENESFTPSSIF